MATGCRWESLDGVAFRRRMAGIARQKFPAQEKFFTDPVDKPVEIVAKCMPRKARDRNDQFLTTLWSLAP